MRMNFQLPGNIQHALNYCEVSDVLGKMVILANTPKNISWKFFAVQNTELSKGNGYIQKLSDLSPRKTNFRMQNGHAESRTYH